MLASCSRGWYTDLGVTSRMPDTQVTMSAYQCNRCDHVWVPKLYKSDSRPKVCPKCKSAYWESPRREKKPA